MRFGFTGWMDHHKHSGLGDQGFVLLWLWIKQYRRDQQSSSQTSREWWKCWRRITQPTDLMRLPAVAFFSQYSESLTLKLVLNWFTKVTSPMKGFRTAVLHCQGAQIERRSYGRSEPKKMEVKHIPASPVKSTGIKPGFYWNSKRSLDKNHHKIKQQKLSISKSRRLFTASLRGSCVWFFF